MFEYRTQDPDQERTTRLGGVDLVISLTADQAAALGPDALNLADAFDTVLTTIAAKRSGADPMIPDDVLATRPAGFKRLWADRAHSLGPRWSETALRETSGLLALLTGVRDAVLRDLVDAGYKLGGLAGIMGVARSTAQNRVNLAEPGPAELWATGGYGSPDHPGQRVPKELREWGLAWPGYTPVNITPEELRAEALAAGAPDWVQDTVADPAEIGTGEWNRRMAAAIKPFHLDAAGRPQNPDGRTGRVGRNLPSWAENAMADALVLTRERKILLIKRGDTGEWAVPGGKVKPGESPIDAALRELREETGLDFIDDAIPASMKIMWSGYVKDPRETDWSWACTTVLRCVVDEELPVRSGDDAAAAAWWPMADMETLDAALAEAGGSLYPAHRAMLAVEPILP